MKKNILFLSCLFLSCGTQTEPQPTEPVEIDMGQNTDTFPEQGVFIDTSQIIQLDSCESCNFSE